MPQIYAISFLDKEILDRLGIELIRIVEEMFNLHGLNDVAFTAVRPTTTINEADVQIEIRYTAGEDEYGTGEPFDPTSAEQKELGSRIRRTFVQFWHNGGFLTADHPNFPSLSTWCKPQYHSTFKIWTPEELMAEVAHH